LSSAQRRAFLWRAVPGSATLWRGHEPAVTPALPSADGWQRCRRQLRRGVR
jgi:hypothetical protein